MSARSNVVIVGGGVIGLTIAYILARRGRPSIVLDQGPLGREASWAGAGILPPTGPGDVGSPLDRLRALSVSEFPSLSAELRQKTGIDNGYRICGAIEFAEESLPDESPESPPSPDVDDEWLGPGAVSEPLDAASAQKLEPALGPGLTPIRNIPYLAQICNPRHVEALIAACQSMIGPDGFPLVDLRPGAGVTMLFRGGARIDGVGTTHGMIEGEAYVIASGAWTSHILRPLGWELPIEPVRGQIVLLHPGFPLIRRVLLQGSRYLVPRAEGRVLVGSTEEHAGFVKQTTAAGVQGLLELATRLVPDLRMAALEKTWAGLRPGNRDGLPYLGRLDDFENLYVAAGHFRAGLQLSIGTGLVMADLIEGKTPAIDMTAFAVER